MQTRSQKTHEAVQLRYMYTSKDVGSARSLLGRIRLVMQGPCVAHGDRDSCERLVLEVAHGGDACLGAVAVVDEAHRPRPALV